MSPLDQLKELLKGRNTEEINTFINMQPTALDEIDEAGISGLMYIAYHQLPEALAFAINKKNDFTLYEAAAVGLLHKVISKVNVQPSQLHIPAKDGFLPLTLACFFGHYPIVAYLIKKGAKVNIAASNPTMVMPLHAAVAKSDHAICELLIKNGAPINVGQTQGITALHSAAHQGNLKLVKLFVENGADVSAKTEDGKTALTFAEQDGHKEILSYLKQKEG